MKEGRVGPSSGCPSCDGIADLYDGVEPATPTLAFHLERDAAARLGRTARDLVDELRAVLAGANGGTLRRYDRLLPIRVRYPDADRFDPARVAALPLVFTSTGAAGAADPAGRSPSSGVVPVSAAARVERLASPAVLTREGLQSMIAVTASTEARDLGSVMKDVARALDGLPVPAGYRMDFEQGASRLIELLIAQRTWTETYIAYETALADHVRALIAVESATGTWDLSF